MRVQGFIIIGVILAIFVAIFGTGWFVNKNIVLNKRSGDTTATSQTATTTPTTKRYTSKQHHFTFTYPNTLTLREYSPDTIALGSSTLQGEFKTSVSASIVEGSASDTYEHFDAFVLARGKVLCAADGPDETLSCDSVLSREPFITTEGVRGEEVHFSLTNQNLTTRASTSKALGPVYVFNLAQTFASSSVPRFVALFLYQPLAEFLQQKQSTVVTEVAKSVSFSNAMKNEAKAHSNASEKTHSAAQTHN